MIGVRAVTSRRRTKAPRTTGEEATTLFESATLSSSLAMSFRPSSVGAISPPSGSPGTPTTLYCTLFSLSLSLSRFDLVLVQMVFDCIRSFKCSERKKQTNF